MNYQPGLSWASAQDATDELKSFRERFHLPAEHGKPWLYFTGNSLGLQPRKTQQYVTEELEDWARLAVEGHFRGRHPWLPYHENLTAATARLVGAKPVEVVVMNTLSTNLHLMMVSFYRPTHERFKILVEGGAFPSDQYAVASQARFHGYDPKEAILELRPRAGEWTLRESDIREIIDRHGKEIALVLLGSVNYLTGQAFDVEGITRAAHAQGCQVGFDFAHGAGNLELKLHDWGPDFAVWCGYKYLNGGPGALSGCFVHERHAENATLPRFAGWWGHDKTTRFQMGAEFKPIAGAEGWQLSNPPILQLAALRASLELFDEAGMARLRKKSERLTGYLEFLLDAMPGKPFEIITPREPGARGCQLSLKVKDRAGAKPLLKRLEENGVVCDFREPDIIRAAPVPLYNSFRDVFLFCETIGRSSS